MRRLTVPCGSLVALAAVVGLAAGDPGNLVVLGKRSATGKNAHAIIVVPKVGSFDKVSVEVTARPNQRATAGWVMLCVGAATGRNFRDAKGRTPMSVRVDLQPGDCRLTADATLSRKGRVTVRVIGR